MGKKSNLENYDIHVINALQKLKTPIIGKNGKEFFIRDKARNESGLEHIADKKHRLKVKDIESIPSILKHPIAEMTDPNNKNYRNYYGIRKTEDSKTFLKIVTWPDKKNPKKEQIITIFPTNQLKLKKT